MNTKIPILSSKTIFEKLYFQVFVYLIIVKVMKIVPSTRADIPKIMEIVSDAQSYLASLGIDQWQNGYPNEERISSDIDLGGSFLIYDNDSNLLGTSFFSTDRDSTYDFIEGEWLTPNDNIYGVIHRVAVYDNHRGTGFARFVFDYFENELKTKNIPSMRIDTHHDNKGMQKLLKNRGYEYCGIIYLEDGNKRLAFEKIIS